jgi:hypothetical protein
MLRIPWTFDSASTGPTNEEDDYDDLDFPPAGSEQSTSFTEDLDEDDPPKKRAIEDDDSDSDEKELEDYELLK